MLIYLDLCSLQRPLDDRSQPRVQLEAEAVLAIIAVCEAGEAELVSSDALEYETARNPYPVRKAYAPRALGKAGRVVRLSADVEQRAQALNQAGFKPLDALHLACAAEAGADYFCTCDDRLLKRAGGEPWAAEGRQPLELIAEIGS
jgi:predicted nucleic acid-binding protein